MRIHCRFRFYDLDHDPRATGEPIDELTLSELGDHIEIFRLLRKSDAR